MNNPRLQRLRRRLRNARRARQTTRLVGRLAECLAVALVACTVVAAIDCSLDLAKGSRMVLQGAALAAIAWFAYRRVVPTLASTEDETDLALSIEHQQQLEGDLVAALQFDATTSRDWGSLQLRQAVIEYVAEGSEHLSFAGGLQGKPLLRGLAVLAVVAALVACIVFTAPEEAHSAWDRWLQRPVQYPRRTIIERVLIDGKAVAIDATRAPIRIMEGASMNFEIHASGALPEVAEVVLGAEAQVTPTIVVLDADCGRAGVYSGKLDRVVSTASVDFHVGDATSARQSLVAIARPAVTLTFQVSPPSYTLAADPSAAGTFTSRHLTTPEGSSIAVTLDCVNKSLREAHMTINGRPFSFTNSDEGAGHRWALPPQGTPLASLRQIVQYRVRVVDVDGLEPADHVQGYVRAKADRPPRVTSSLVTRHVLPQGKPTLSYLAVDDYGISRLRLHRRWTRSEGTSKEDVIELPFSKSDATRVRGTHVVGLESLKLRKGDELLLTLEVRDARGDRPGHTVHGEPIVLHVTDERGVLAAINETDQQTARQMDAIIEREWGVGND